MKPRKTLEKILGGPRNVRFVEMQESIEAFGFPLTRVSGTHHLFIYPDVPGIGQPARS